MLDKDRFPSARALTDKRPTSTPTTRRLSSKSAAPPSAARTAIKTPPVKPPVRTSAKPATTTKPVAKAAGPATTSVRKPPSPVPTSRSSVRKPPSPVPTSTISGRKTPSPVPTRTSTIKKTPPAPTPTSAVRKTTPAPAARTVTRRPVLVRKSSDSSGCASDVSDSSSGSSRSSGSSGKLQRAVVAPPVEPPRISPKRTTLTGKTTGAIKVKIPGTTDKANPSSATAAKTDQCQNCQLRSPILDPMAMEVQANDKALRKIMDLEISNTSLLAVNKSLENTIRQQAQEMEDMRKEIERLTEQAYANASMTAHSRSAATKDVSAVSVQDAPITKRETMIKEDEHVEVTFSRLCATIQQLLEDGKKAAEYQVPAQVVEEAYEQDPETQARRAIARKESRGALGRVAGALRNVFSSSVVDNKEDQMAVSSVPMTVKVNKRASRDGSRLSRSSGSDVSSCSSSSRSSESSGYGSGSSSDQESKSRRLSIVMRPVVETPTHAYLDDPYVLLDNPKPSGVVTSNHQSSTRCQRKQTQYRTHRIMARPDDMDSLLSA